jgi:hypothetical protein
VGRVYFWEIMAKLKDQLKDLATFAKDTAKAAVKGEVIRAAPEEATRRYQICLACPNFEAPKCKLCGCKMGIKVQWQTTKCADKASPKW